MARQVLVDPLRWTEVGLTQRAWDRMSALARFPKSGFPRSKSEFIRQAVDEKLDSFEGNLLARFPGAILAA